MFKKLFKNKRAQQTAEYALLISLVVAAVIAMQTYAQRAIQARIRDASQYMTTQTVNLGTTNQYEPYYTSSSYEVTRESEKTETQTNTLLGVGENERRTREKGTTGTSYDTSLGLINGL